MTSYDEKRWVTAHAAAHFEAYPGLVPARGDRTVSGRITVGITGERIRLVLTGRMGVCPVIYSRISVASGGLFCDLTFWGQGAVTVPADGGEVISDPVRLPVSAGDAVTLWMYSPDGAAPVTVTHLECCSAEGDMCGEVFEGTGGSEPLCSYARLEVETTDKSACAIAAFGDSITAMELWTAPLRKCIEGHRTQTALLNLGIGGNRLLRDSGIPAHRGVISYGRSGLRRFEDDCLRQSGLKGVIISLGINDIGAPGKDPLNNRPMSEFPTLEQMTGGYAELVSRCRRRGLNVACATITPLKGVDTYRQESDELRCAVNYWIRTCGLFDAVLDFDAAVGQGKDQPLKPKYDSGDHIHPNRDGGKAMVDSVDVPALLEALLK